ncbi:hypothetical protein M433DRAFT_45399, partial [Acidomyces richmondensis BFW]
QLAWEGPACDSVLTQADDSSGYDVENAEDYTAKTISSTGANFRHQRDKICKSAGAIGDAAGAGAGKDPVANKGVSVDGTLASGAVDACAQARNTEASTLENAGSAVPK